MLQQLMQQLKKKQDSGTTTLIISNEEMNDILKIVKALEDSNILLKGITKTIKNETNKQKRGFLSMLLGSLGATITHKMFEINFCEIAHNGKSLISVFQEFSASINKTFILAGRLGTRLSFYEV